jgi:hypothetical protein
MLALEPKQSRRNGGLTRHMPVQQDVLCFLSSASNDTKPHKFDTMMIRTAFCIPAPAKSSHTGRLLTVNHRITGLESLLKMSQFMSFKSFSPTS